MNKIRGEIQRSNIADIKLTTRNLNKNVILPKRRDLRTL